MKRKRCAYCRQPHNGCSGQVSFTHKEFKLTTHFTIRKCGRCFKKDIIEAFNQYGRILVKKTKSGKIKIDWAWFIEHMSGDTHWTKEVAVLRLLIALGIFSAKKEGNWEIDHHRTLKNPIFEFGIQYRPLYFTRKEDAIEYAHLKLTEHDEPWTVQQYGKVLTQKDVLEDKQLIQKDVLPDKRLTQEDVLGKRRD